MLTHYSRAQIRLHWVIFAIIVLQFVFHEPIAQAWHRFEDGQEVVFSPLIGLHVLGGLSVLFLALWRIFIRLKRGAPPLPPEEPRLMKLGAHITHLALYILMILLPISGAAAWFGGIIPAAEAHEVMRAILFFLILLHTVAALYHQFVLKTNLLDRMRTAGKD